MGANLEVEFVRGLERSCDAHARERIVAAPASAGLERIEARFFGAAFVRHRHDTYALGVTLAGVQTFWYRGAQRRSLPGQILVLHPDEIHDGGAGDESGLRYRMLYVEPALLRRALGEGASPPFVGEPVFDDAALRGVLAEALGPLDLALDEIESDDIVGRLSRALARRAGRPARPLAKTAARPAQLARDYLEANLGRAVSSTSSSAPRASTATPWRGTFAPSTRRARIAIW